MQIPKHNPFQWIIGVFILFLSLAHCVPVEYIYTGDDCDCPRELAYHVNYPQVPRTRKCPLYNYGYKIEKPKQPPPGKAHVTYTFDFTVEEPKIPKKPRNYERLPNLYAKVDRVTTNRKKDCYSHGYEKPYRPPTKPHRPSCGCNQCGSPSRDYRYVFQAMSKPKRDIKYSENLKPICKCQKSDCPFQARQKELQLKQKQHIFLPFYGRMIRTSNGFFQTLPAEKQAVKVFHGTRKRRDLRKFLLRAFQPKEKPQPEKKEKYVKKYNTNLNEKPKNFWDFKFPKLDAGFEQLSEDEAYEKSKKKSNKMSWFKSGSHKMKRDIKGEYDLLEKERSEMDLTLPDIIQYMPETLQPNFKRGQCFLSFQEEDNKQQTEQSKILQGDDQQEHRSDNEQPAGEEKSSEKSPNEGQTNDENDTEEDSSHSEEQNDLYNVNENLDDLQRNNIIKENSGASMSSAASTSNYQKRDANNYNPNNFNANGYNAKSQTQTQTQSQSQQPQNNYQPQPQQQSQASAVNSFHSMNLCPFHSQNAYQRSFEIPSEPPYPFLSAQNAYSTPSMLPYDMSYLPFQENFYQPESQARAHVTTAPSSYPLGYDPLYPAPQPHFRAQYYEIQDPFFHQHNIFRDFKYLPNYAEIQKYLSGLPITDPLSDDQTPLHFTGDLESSSYVNPYSPLLGRSHAQPVHHLSNEELDKIITDIIYRHPDFIEASAHPGGALVDPEPQQKQQTVGFLKKLIGGRLHKWFGNSHEDERSYSPNDYNVEFDPSKALDAYYTRRDSRDSAYASSDSEGASAKASASSKGKD